MKIKLFLLITIFLSSPAIAQQGSITLYRNINFTLLRSSILLSKTATIPVDYAKSCPHRIIQRQTPIFLYQNLCKLCFENKVDLLKENKNKINNNKYFHSGVHFNISGIRSGKGGPQCSYPGCHGSRGFRYGSKKIK